MSQPEINLKLIERIARLTAIEFSKTEKETFLEEFKDIMKCVHQIQVVSPPVSPQSVVSPSPLRPDKPHQQHIHPETFSPYLEDGFFKVPKVIE